MERSRPRPNRGALSRTLVVFLALASLGLAVFCLVHAGVAYEAFVDPSAALRWDATQPDALSTLASRRSQDSTTPQEDAEALGYARRALLVAPLDAQALRVLALEAERQGDGDKAARLMALAEKRSLRDTLTQLWLFAHETQGHDPGAASLRADSLMRRQPELAPLLFPLIERTLGEPAARDAYVARLAEAPDWRHGFLTDLVRLPDVATARAVYSGLAATHAPPTDEELGFLLTRLIADGDYQGARVFWTTSARSALASDAPYDGDFRGLGGAPPFNWRLADDDGTVADLANAPDGRTALHVQSSPTATKTLAEQLLVLRPGVYRLSGEVLMDAVPTGAAFSWGVTCLPRGEQLGADATQTSATWQGFSMSISVPAGGCQAQWLRLSGLAREGFDTASAWFRGLRVRRLAP